MVLGTDNFISDMIRSKTGIGKTGIKTVYNLRIDFGRHFCYLAFTFCLGQMTEVLEKYRARLQIYSELTGRIWK